MARILILGADGMVGHVARIHLAERGHEVLAVARSASPHWTRLDVEDTGALLAFTARARPQWVLNCTGVLIQESEQDPVRAIRLNALLPQVLAAAAGDQGFRLIQTSTDCVFSGARGPYRETDLRDADSTYGRTKALGEVLAAPALTVRTSKIGPELKPGSGLFHWFMGQRGVVRGFGRALWGGVTTLELAKAVDHIVAHPATGLVHLTNGAPISKHDLLALLAEVFGPRGVTLQRDDSVASDRSLVCTRGDFGHAVPPYRTMFEELRAFMAAHAELYAHYV